MRFRDLITLVQPFKEKRLRMIPATLGPRLNAATQTRERDTFPGFPRAQDGWTDYANGYQPNYIPNPLPDWHAGFPKSMQDYG